MANASLAKLAYVLALLGVVIMIIFGILSFLSIGFPVHPSDGAITLSPTVA